MENKLNFLQFKNSLYHKRFDSKNSLGRRYEEDEELSLYGESYDPFQLDVDKIRLGKFFRRLADKTQVFPVNCHKNIRTRLIHTNEVVSISSFAANLLGLNQKLVEAIAYGHDIGHTPYGHLGERIISKISGRDFSHAVMSVVVCQMIERGGKGLNLSYETLRGILNHSNGGRKIKATDSLIDEEALVMMCDKIAYIFSDISDCFRLGYLNDKFKPPSKLFDFFGKSQRERVATALHYLIIESSVVGRVSFSLSKEAEYFLDLRSWMYENVYLKIDKAKERLEREGEIENIYKFFSNNPSFKDCDPLLTTAILTDSEAISFSGCKIDHCSGYIEIVEKIKKSGCKIDIFDPDLNENDFRYHKSTN